MNRLFRTLLTTLVLSPAAVVLAQGGPKKDAEVKDYTDVKPESLGVKPVEPTKDPKTGFLVGGKNPTELIRKLTEINGRRIDVLERDMRPKKLSKAGFLGADEKLLDVLAMDNDYVLGELGLTHQELARHLHVIGVIARGATNNDQWVTFRYHGQTFRAQLQCARGYQDSPFQDDTKANCNATLENVATGKKLVYSLLVPMMMERYGFYEGKGTPYRVEPRQIVEVLGFLRGKAKG